jgi:FkbM family methyltransferase
MKNYILKNITGDDVTLNYNDVTKRILDEYKPSLGQYLTFITDTQELYDFLFSGFGDKKITVLDIGANGGFFSLYCAPICERVYAIEPSAVLCRTIKEFSSEQDNIIICNNAISNQDGMINYFFFPDCTGQSTIHNRAKAKNAEAIKLSVTAYSVLSFIKKHKIDHVDICKMDIEGEEVNIFNDETIESLESFVSKFWVEVHHTAHINGKLMEQNYIEITQRFKDKGYNLYGDIDQYGFIAYK